MSYNLWILTLFLAYSRFSSVVEIHTMYVGYCFIRVHTPNLGIQTRQIAFTESLGNKNGNELCISTAESVFVVSGNIHFSPQPKNHFKNSLFYKDAAREASDPHRPPHRNLPSVALRKYIHTAATYSRF
jgi:hypothetical protein